MSKIQQTAEDLDKHLAQQLAFLAISADSYDKGFEGEAKRLATTIRVLMHDTDRSTSLLTQLDIKDGVKFYDSGMPSRPGMQNMGASLVVLSCGVTNKAICFGDDGPPGTTGYVNFEEYWNRNVVFAGENHFSRKEIILLLANQDGGAHIDPLIDLEYAKLTRENSFGWSVSGALIPHNSPVTITELATVRQIAHEILRTFVKDYPLKHIPKNMGPLAYPRFFFSSGPDKC